MESLEVLTEEIFEKYGNRKKDKRLSIIVDTKNFIAYAVPKEIEHIEFLRKYFGKEDSKFVPVHLDFNDEFDISAVITGESGVEQGYGIRHTTDELIIAQQKALELISSSIFSASEDCEYKLCYEYANFK